MPTPNMKKLLVAGLLLSGCHSLSADHHQSISGKIKEVGAEYGNLDTDIAAARLAAKGIKQGDAILVTCNGNSYTMTFGETYSDVAKGEWISFVNWEKNVRVARNSANASETSGCLVGDVVTLTATPPS